MAPVTVKNSGEQSKEDPKRPHHDGDGTAPEKMTKANVPVRSQFYNYSFSFFVLFIFLIRHSSALFMAILL